MSASLKGQLSHEYPEESKQSKIKTHSIALTKSIAATLDRKASRFPPDKILCCSPLFLVSLTRLGQKATPFIRRLWRNTSTPSGDGARKFKTNVGGKTAITIPGLCHLCFQWSRQSNGHEATALMIFKMRVAPCYPKIGMRFGTGHSFITAPTPTGLAGL